MPAPDLLGLFIEPFNRLALEYMVTGAVAAIVYGEPRLTHDIDVVMALRAADAPRVVAAFPPPDFYAPPAEVIALEVGRPTRGHFNLIHIPTALKADVYPVGEDPLHQWGFPRRRKELIAGAPLWLAPPEYVIVRKLQYLREGESDKHIRDIRAMLRLSPDAIDQEALAEQVALHGLETEWAKCQ
ncbi:MAG: hypothetical protein WD773_04910 [Gemmatimonadales bacterium]